MIFYFYTNKNIMFDFLGRNIIAPDTIVKDIKRYRTIATASDYFLFVTHKKLDRKSRELGIAEPEFVYPLTIELTESQEDGKAILVSKTENGYEYAFESLSTYDVDKHIGAYLIGEVPLSRINKIYFDTQDDMDMFSRPSPDYWYPTNKYALLPEDFNEELQMEVEQDKLIDICGIKVDDIISGYRRREKKRAAILNLINGTKRWQLGKYIFNIDGSLQQLLEIKDEEISAILPHYFEMQDNGKIEYLSLCTGLDKSNEFNQIIYDSVCEILSAQPYNTQKQPDYIVEVLNDICGTILSKCEDKNAQVFIKQTIVEIQKLISDSSDKGPEEIIAPIPETIDVLKALLFVSKNPNRYELFLEALEAYHADQLTRRRAAVLWGMFNGLYGMPGEDFNKDNQILWQFIESLVYKAEEAEKPTLIITKPELVIDNCKILGIQLKEERIVTAAEIRDAILAMPKEKLTKAFYEKLLDAAVVEYGSKKKVDNKGYTHVVASVELAAINAGDELTADIKKVLEQLVKDYKNPVPNKEKLFADYIEAKGRFDFVYELDPGYWKRAIKVVTEKKDDK